MMTNEEMTQQYIQQQPVEQPKKSKSWIWLLVGALVLIILGLVAWILISGNSPGSEESVIGSIKNIGNSIPQPPALPD